MAATDGAIRVAFDAQDLAVLMVDVLAAADATIGADRDGHLRVANARVQLLAAPAQGIGDKSDVATHDVTQTTSLIVRCRYHEEVLSPASPNLSSRRTTPARSMPITRSQSPCVPRMPQRVGLGEEAIVAVSPLIRMRTARLSSRLEAHLAAAMRDARHSDNIAIATPEDLTAARMPCIFKL